MIKLLADIIADPDFERRIRERRRLIEEAEKTAADSVDTIQQVVQQVSDGVSSGGGSHTLLYVLGGIVAALVGLVFLIFIARSYLRSCRAQRA